MKTIMAAVVAALSLSLLTSGCSAKPAPAPVVSEGAVNEQSPFRPDKSNCVSDLTVYNKMFGDLYPCLVSGMEEIDRRPGLDLPKNPRQTYSDDQYQHSPCQSDLTKLSSVDLGQCVQMTRNYLFINGSNGS